MGAFFLIRKAPGVRVETCAAKADELMQLQGFGTPSVLDFDDHVLYSYQKIIIGHKNYLKINCDDYCCCVGTLIYDGQIGSKALELIYERIDEDAFFNVVVHGEYCLIVRKAQKFYLMVDDIGIYKTFVDSKNYIFSSSFLVVSALIESRKINEQSVYEYVFNGATYGDETIFRDISLVASNYIHTINNEVRYKKKHRPLSEMDDINKHEDYCESNLTELTKYFGVISDCFGKDIGTALSGGYDSRLALALLLKHKTEPWLYVYGKSTDLDVTIAREIASQQGFDLCHTDKTSRSKFNANEIGKQIETNYYFFDGYPPEGIFNNGRDRETRYERYKKRSLIVNGGGGAIFRNFFALPDTPFTVKQLLWAFYSRFEPNVCSSRFNETSFHATLGKKIQQALDTDSETLVRKQVELVFILFRCRYWMGRNNSINNRLGYSLTPFVDTNIIREALKVPLKEKNCGRFEGWLIRKINPDLAGYNSCYGHNFSSNPPIKQQLIEYSTIFRPTWIRRYTYRIKIQAQRRKGPYFQMDDWRAKLLGGGFPYMSRFFKIDSIRDQSHYNRICTLEYLFQRVGSDMPGD